MKPIKTLCWKTASFAVLVTLSSCHLATLSSAAEQELVYAERTLRKAGAKTDGEGLLQFIRSRTLNEEQRKALADRVRALGASEYAERESASRELVKLGRVALPYLRPAVNDPDLEIARRARRCLERIQKSPHPSLSVLAALLVKERRPPGAVSVLLDYLPNVEDEALEETWLDVLRAVAWRAGRADPVLFAALKDKRAVYRAAAAQVLGRGDDAKARQRVAPLLADAEARVRFESAAALARFGDKKAIAVLLHLLEDGPFTFACRSEYLLRLLAGERGPEASLDKDDNAVRRQCRSAWETWWKKNGAGVDLSRLKAEEPPRGLTDVCEDGDDGSRVWQWAEAGQPCWEILHLEGAHDAHALLNGRVLIAEHHAKRVSERDREGKIHWQLQTLDNPIGCRRLANGNTLIVTYKTIYEVTPTKEVVFQHNDRRDFRDALRLSNGHILYVAGDGTLVEWDATDDHILHTIVPENYALGAKYRARVEPLLNGRYLLALGGSNRVVEIDKTGKIRWEHTVRAPMSATRLRNGHTLIACFEDRCVVEVDRAGKEIAKQSLQGRPFAARRY
jgi:HEAT repeat protein